VLLTLNSQTQAQCVAPKNLRAEEVTKNMALIKWDAGSSTIQYIVQVTKDTTVNWVRKVTTPYTCATIGGMKSNTLYYCRIRAMCSDSTYVWSSYITFKTAE